ncbi:TPM domain-containing protein [Undibacterium fentianense]|uniref:TPM domain-containing protein n=1 Tax=Undibacterium fentianense TaxID=2828728 RepID=A0A941DYZ5_9BURK|nr:TPM domain-containing protein [Undibacterium fentianense]MBR7799375.1 TPM domain-containing protein [Undibacterium fentianense]
MNQHRVWSNLRTRFQINPYRKYFNLENRQRLGTSITQAERGHRGEIKIVVETHLSLNQLSRGLTPRERALEWFSNLRIWDTEENSGILLYLLLAERRIEIIADRGITKMVEQSAWDKICADLQNQLAADKVIDGLCDASQRFGDLLRQHFPQVGDSANPDELSNEVIFIP